MLFCFLSRFLIPAVRLFNKPKLLELLKPLFGIARVQMNLHRDLPQAMRLLEQHEHRIIPPDPARRMHPCALDMIQPPTFLGTKLVGGAQLLSRTCENGNTAIILRARTDHGSKCVGKLPLQHIGADETRALYHIGQDIRKRAARLVIQAVLGAVV